MGGPTDEEPPKLISSDPVDQSTGIRPEKIVLTFDEFVGLDNPGKGISHHSKNQQGPGRSYRPEKHHHRIAQARIGG